jgi:pimeloyl-ACP methyl ester carboxylesterase
LNDDVDRLTEEAVKPVPGACVEQQIQFENHLGEILAGTLHYPQRPSGVAVVAGHCFTCSRHTGIIRRICNDLNKASFTVLRFDFSGNGQSQGRFEQSTWSKQIREMEAAVTLVRDRGADWIGLTGHSLGAAIALLAAQRIDSIAAVCRVAGRFSSGRLMHFLSPPQQRILAETGQVEFTSRSRQLTLNQDFFDDAQTYDLEAATRSLAIPMLVVHGDQDDIIPVAEAHRSKEANPKMVQLLEVEGGDHMFSRPDHQQTVGRTVTEWFCRQAGVSVPDPFAGASSPL